MIYITAHDNTGKTAIGHIRKSINLVMW